MNRNIIPPGVWNLGDLQAGDELELTYIADISTDQHAGKYADLAWASGKAAYDESNLVLALGLDSTYVNGNFVGTQVPVNKNTQESVSAGVEKTETVTGQVLGATTELPGTGAATIWLIISSLLGIAGFSLLKISKKTMLTILLTLLSFGLLISPIKAVDNIVVRVEEPKSPSNIKNIDLKFVALDASGASITAKCFKKGPTDAVFSQFGSDIILTDGGNSSSCVLSSVINDNGSYQFYVTANSAVSNTVNLDYKNSTPGTPTDYRKEQINSCDYKIHFKSADDGDKTVKVELYRSTSTDFSANNETLVHSVNVGSNQEKDIYISVPDCTKSYYYVLRAFDNAGNGSGLIGDSVVKTIIETNTTTTTTTGSVSGAIPLIGEDNIPTETELDQEATSGENQEGTVLGAQETTNPKSLPTQFQSFINRHKFTSALIALLVLVIIGYVVKRIGKKKR